MTIADQIKAGFVAAIAELKATFTSSTSSTTADAGKAGKASQEASATPVADEVMSAIKAQLQADMKPVLEQLTTANSEINRLKAELQTANDQVTKLKGEAKTTDELAAEKARQTTAAQGVPTSQLPAGKAGDAAETLESVQAQMANETDPEKRGALALKCRALRGHTDLFASEKK